MPDNNEAKKPTYEELEKYVSKLENKVYRTLRTELINRTLFDIANALNNSATLQDLYRSIQKILSNLMDMTNFYIAIYHKKRNAIQFVYHVDQEDDFHFAWIENFTQDRSLTGDVILAKRPLLLKEDELIELKSKGRVKGKLPKIWLGVPLMIGGEVMGVMTVQSYTNPDQFSQTDVDVLSFVSDQVALCIETKKSQERMQKTQEKLIRTEKLEAIGTLAGGIAHDFNNTLSITLGNINLAQMMVSDQELRGVLDDAEKSVMQAKELASKFIVFSQGGVIIKKKVNAIHFIQETLASISDEMSIPYRLEMGMVPETIEISPDQLKEAIKNIMVNAREAMGQKGEVRLVFKLHEEKTGYVLLSIIDCGKGIEKNKIGRVFEPYYSTKSLGKDKGTGLGMSIAYSIINSHNGEIIIDSALDKGTRVDIILPVSHQEDKFKKQSQKKAMPGSADDEKDLSKKEAPRDSAKRKILVMDDDEMILEMSVKILERLGYEAVTAKNGKNALEVYEKEKQSDNPVAAVILDLEVKQGMGGADTMKALLKIEPGVKAIIASGYSSDRVMENYHEYGFAMAIPKPYSMNTLDNALEELINS